MYEIKRSNSFKKDLKLAKKRKHNLQKLKTIIQKLQKAETLPFKNKDHNLTSNW